VATDVPAYEIKSDGIDLGRDGTVKPWSQTEWSGPTDFQRSTLQVVDRVDAGGETLVVKGRPDPLNRGDGLQYEVTAEGSERHPDEFKNRTLHSMSDVRDAIEKYAQNASREAVEGISNAQKVETVDNGWTIYSFISENDGEQKFYVETEDEMYLLATGEEVTYRVQLSSMEEVRTAIENATGGSVDSGSETSTPSTVSVVEELGYGWALAETAEGEFLVVRRQDGSRVYLDSDGVVRDSRQTFASKSRARQAFRRWRLGERRRTAHRGERDTSRSPTADSRSTPKQRVDEHDGHDRR